MKITVVGGRISKFDTAFAVPVGAEINMIDAEITECRKIVDTVPAPANPKESLFRNFVGSVATGLTATAIGRCMGF